MDGRAAVGPGGITKAERMATGSVFSFGSLVIVRLTTIVNSIVIVRALGLFNVGVFSVVTLTISVVTVAAGFGVSSAVVKFLAEVPRDRPDEASRLLRAGTVITLAATVISVGALGVLAPLLGDLYNEPQVPALLLLAAIGLTLNSVTSPLLSTFQAFELIRERGILNVVAAVLSVPTTLALVLVWGLVGAVLATVANTVISILVNVPLIRTIWRDRGLSWKAHPDRATYRRMFGYAVPTLISALLVTAVLWFTSTFLATEASLDEVGLYSVGSGLAAYLLFIPSAIGIPLIPIVSRLDRTGSPELSPFLIRTLRVTAFLLLPPTLVLLAFPEPFLAVLFGAEYVTATAVVLVVTPAIFLAGISTIVGFGIAGKGKMWHGLLVNLLWAVVFVGGSLALVAPRAAVGLSLAYLAGYGVQFLGIMVYVRYYWSMPLHPMFVPVVLGLVSMGAVLAASVYIPPPWRAPVMAAAIVLVSFAELPAMSRREIEVLVGPIRRFATWLNASRRAGD